MTPYNNSQLASTQNFTAELTAEDISQSGVLCILTFWSMNLSCGRSKPSALKAISVAIMIDHTLGGMTMSRLQN